MSEMKKIKVNAERNCFYNFEMEVPIDATDDDISTLASNEMANQSYEVESDIDWEESGVSMER